MALYKKTSIDNDILLLIWKIEESMEELSFDILLKPESKYRLQQMKSELHQKGVLSIRHLLKEAGYSDMDLFYDVHGKPCLKDENFISITHSFIFTGIIVSKETPVGIDIEKQRDKITKIAHKFTPVEAYRTIARHNVLVRKLTIVWGAKESLYKIYGKKKILFLPHIYIEDFKFADTKTTGEIRYGGTVAAYTIYFLEFEGFTCVYAF